MFSHQFSILNFVDFQIVLGRVRCKVVDVVELIDN